MAAMLADRLMGYVKAYGNFLDAHAVNEAIQDHLLMPIQESRQQILQVLRTNARKQRIIR